MNELIEVSKAANLSQTSGATGSFAKVGATGFIYKFIEDGSDYDVNNVDIFETASGGLTRWVLCETIGENWHQLDATDEPALQNSWQQCADPLQRAAFRKQKQSIHFQGCLVPGDLTQGTLLFTLPEGYRPNENLEVILPAASEGVAQALLDVNKGGEVSLRADLTGLTNLILTGLNFTP